MESYCYDNQIHDDEKFFSWLRSMRRWIHQHAELSFQEKKTSHFIRARLEELGVEEVQTLNGTGVVAIIPGKDRSLPKVGLRADMDALTLQEETNISYKSINDGVMHACGHDGHTTMLLGAVALLKEADSLLGDVVCIFQPAEESGYGARGMVEEGAIDGVDAIFAGHIDTHYETGVITVDDGIICAFADSFTITIKGRGGHAARPHESVDALVAASSLVMNTQTLISREVDPNHAAVITIGRFEAGTVHNVIAEEAVLEGTIRCTNDKTRKNTMDNLERMVQAVADMYGVKASLKYNEGLPAVINDASAACVARATANSMNNVISVVSQGQSSLGGEDFAYYQDKIPGCLVRFGASLPHAGVAHSGTFDFDEDVLVIGAHWLANVAISWQQKVDE